jgi:uncharacterized caspase-like protein
MRWRRLAALLLLGLCHGAHAAQPSAQPQPRVAYAMHSARINQIRATPDLLRLVSVGQDKTVRVWRMADLQLLRTIYVPSEPGEEGALRALAITPDGREVIVGGWTGISWSGQGQLYRFDLASGRLLQTLRGFPALIETLSISRDGARLAVGLGARAGLRIVALPSGRELGRDADYAERVSFADFSADGTLATTSRDGCVRLYDAQGRIVFRAEYPPRADADGRACKGSELGGIRFSPDGARLAFGLQDRVQLAVMDVASKTILRELTVDDPLQQSLCCPNWSADGKQLFMHGLHAGEAATPLYQVALAGGATRTLPIGRQRFTNVLPLPDGGLVFSSAAPSLARIDAGGARIAEALPPNGDFRFDWRAFRLSADGMRVTLPLRADGADAYTFEVGARVDAAYRRATPADAAAGAAPLRTGTLRLDATLGELGYKQPVRLGALQVALKPTQSVHSWAQAPKRSLVVLGTQWSILAVDGQGKHLWEHDLPAPAYQVNISADGRWAVAAVGDGSIRWYALEQGAEALSAFLHNNGEDWVLWRPDGYYASSPKGDDYFGWLSNEGDSAAPRFVRAVQVERELYRPDLVARRAAAPPGATLALALQQLAVPRVTIEAVRPGAPPGTLEVRFSAEANGQALRELGVYVDGVPVLRSAERAVGAAEGQRLSRVLTVPLSAGAGVVRVEAETATSIGLDQSAPPAPPPPRPPRAGRLWVVLAGVDQFDIPAACPDARPCVPLQPLPNAANDAHALAERLLQQQGRAFSSVSATVLSGRSASPATRDNLLRALRALEQAQPEDTVLVFLASHGFAADAASEYFFIPKDASARDLLAIAGPGAKGRMAAGAAPSLISGSELAAVLRRVPGRRILLLDTCHSGAADGSSDAYALSKRSAAAQVAVLSASRGDELSWESLDGQHGAFTLAMLEALGGRAGAPGQALTLRTLFDYARPRVIDNARRIREKKIDGEARQTPTMTAPPALQATVLALPN